MGLLSILIHRCNPSLEIVVCWTTIYWRAEILFVVPFSIVHVVVLLKCNYITCPYLWYITKDRCLLHIQTCLSPYLWPYGHVSSPNEIWSNVLRPMINRSTEFRKSAKPISPSASNVDDWYWSENQLIHPFVRCNHQLLWQCRPHPSLEGRNCSWRIAWSVVVSLSCCQGTNIAT